MVFLFLLGLAIGSFLNCLVCRLNHQQLPMGRSFCPKCKHQLAWRDNLPLLSFVLLRGRCRYCQKRISFQYPLIELATGLLTVFVVAHLGGATTLLVVYALVAIFISDLLYLTIPDAIIWPAIALAFLFQPQNLLVGLAAAGLFLLLVLITRGRGMGLGDVKLAGLMGLFLGWPKTLVAFYVAFLTGALVGVILILLKKKKLKDPVPFGPFLVAGTLVSLFWTEPILRVILNWF